MEGVVVVVSEISSSVAIPLPAHVLQGCSGGLLLGFLPALLFLQPTLSHNDWRKAGSGIHIRFFFNLFIYYYYLVALGLRCCVQIFSSCGGWVYFLLQCMNFL